MARRKTAMKVAEMKPYKERLLDLRARLRGDVSSLVDRALTKNRGDANGGLSTMPIHMADVGSDNFEQEFSLSLMQSEEDTLSMIEGALERIESRVYGTCAECGNRIKKTRLNAIPHTPHCITCAEEIQSDWRR